MKHISLLFLTLLALDLHAQTGLDQKTLLAQFEGNWTTEQGDQHLNISAGSYLDGLGMTIVFDRKKARILSKLPENSLAMTRVSINCWYWVF